MTTDYKSRITRKQKKPLPGYLWLLSGLAIGLFIAFIVYLDKQPENNLDFGSAVQSELEKLKKQAKNQKTTTTSTVAPTPKTPATKKTSTEKPVTEKKETRYNFYTLLPELEVLIPESETRPPERPSKNNSTNLQSNTKAQLSTKKQYILQVGSFQNLSDAKKLKANLAFLGVAAGIQHVTINNQAWHRVRTGPYQNRQQLSQKQKLLKQNGISYISMELK